MTPWRRRAGTLSEPAAEGDFADPFVLGTPQGYVAYATNAAGCNVQVRTSTDLRTWRRGADALPVIAPWASAGFTWSPAVLERGDGHVLWYVVREPSSARQVISVARADASRGPTGPFIDRSTTPAVAQFDLGGSIDPSPFVDDDGAAYLLWKADANAINRPSTLWAQRLNDDGDAVVGAATMLLGMDRGWERPLIEAPSMVHAKGTYWLFYSGGWWESDTYGIGYATAEHPLGPWTKCTTRRAWAASHPRGAGPGGQEVFRSPEGTLYLAYHAWAPDRVGYGAGGVRSLRLGVLDLSGLAPVLTPLPDVVPGSGS